MHCLANRASKWKTNNINCSTNPSVAFIQAQTNMFLKNGRGEGKIGHGERVGGGIRRLRVKCDPQCQIF